MELMLPQPAPLLLLVPDSRYSPCLQYKNKLRLSQSLDLLLPETHQPPVRRGPGMRTGISLVCPIINQLGHKKLIICFSGTALKNFYCITTNKCEKSSAHCELSVKSGRHLPCSLVHVVSMVGWLAEFWCTHSRNSTPLIKSQKFLRNMVRTLFLFAKGKKIKIKSHTPPSFSE